MTNPTIADTQAVAVLGLAELARYLAGAGLRVVTGDTFRAAAVAANAQIKVAPIAMVLADLAVAGTSPWVEKVVRTCPVVMVGIDLGGKDTRIAGNTTQATRLPAPVQVDTILTAVGLSPVGDGAVLAADGTVTAGSPNLVVDTDGTWGELDELEAVIAKPQPPAPVVPAPAPVVPIPVVAPTAPAVDFWGSTPVAPPVPVVPIAQPAPAVPTGDALRGDRTPTPVPEPADSYEEPEFTMPAINPTPTPAPWENYIPPATPPAPWDDVAAPVEVAPATIPYVQVTEPVRPPVMVAEQIGVDTGYSPTLGRSFAPCILSIAGKGGVGKTSIALALAQRAAILGQMKVVLVDGNRGQGDLRTYLSLNRSGLPTIYDAITSGDPGAAIVTPDRLNANRPEGGEQLGFALVQAPPRGLTDPETITSALYHDVITAARAASDLVVMDTQIVEGSERGMFDELLIPMLASHAYGVAIADLSRPGVDNLIAHLAEFIAQGVPVERLMTMLNRVPATTEYDLQRTSEALGRYGVFLDAVPADPQVHSSMAYGTSIYDNPALAPVLDKILLRVTGNPVFNQVHQSAAAGATKKRGLFGRRR